MAKSEIRRNASTGAAFRGRGPGGPPGIQGIVSVNDCFLFIYFEIIPNRGSILKYL